VSFDSAVPGGTGATVWGELRLPDTGARRLPAVVVLHSSSGAYHDHHSDAFVAVLNRAGIATLWIEMFPDRSRRPRSTRESLPQAYGALLYLARHPRVEPRRIGVLGFSWGGAMSVVMSSRDITQQYTGGKARFAAHLALYPVCWAHQRIVEGKNPVYGADAYRHVTGAPVHILAGEKDDYDEPDSCPKFVAALPEDVRRHFGVTVYPGATHSFDGDVSFAQVYDRYAHAGRGGRVTLRSDAAAAAKARAFAVKFFSENLAP
jgi:dienelactone hydrolase